MHITRSGSPPSNRGPAAYFKGTVRTDASFNGNRNLSGTTVVLKPGEKHWRGAARDAAMSHIAIAEMQDGKAVDWLEHVSDEDLP